MARQKLVESFKVRPTMIRKVEFKEAETQIQIEKETVKCEGVYTFPTSRPGQKNLNERVYSKKLWEKVIKEGQGVGSYGLMDHPAEEGSTKDRWCVWKNVRFSDDKSLVLADAYLFGHWGREVKEGLEAGGEVGLSTVGYGDFKEDGFTIDEATYELDRVADFVLNPSYEVYGKAEDAVVSEDEGLEKEGTIKNEDSAQIELTQSKDDTMETTVKKDRVSTLEEKNFRMNIRNVLKEVEAKELSDRVPEYEELLSYFEDVEFATDMKDEIAESLAQARTEVLELAEKGKSVEKLTESATTLEAENKVFNEELEELKSSNTSLEENYNQALQLLDSVKVFANKMRDLYKASRAKANGMVSAAEYREIAVYTEEKESEIQTLTEELVELKRANKDLTEKVETIRESKKGASEQKLEEEVKVEEEAQEEVQEEQKFDESGCTAEVLNYYYDLENMNSQMVLIKEEILSKRTLMEAQRTFLRLKGIVEESTDVDRRDINRSDTIEKKEPHQELRAGVKPHKGWV